MVSAAAGHLIDFPIANGCGGEDGGAASTCEMRRRRYSALHNKGNEMVRVRDLPIAGCLLLAACGGSGGSVNSTPAPPTGAPSPTPSPSPTPPAVVGNATLTDLVASQSFTNDAGSTNVSFDTVTRTTINGRTVPGALTVAYDRPTNSYVLTSAGASQTFGPSEVVANDADETRYQRTNAEGNSYLTIARTPYSGGAARRYVGLGFWQRNTRADARQDTQFNIFTYGLETPATGVPRTGTAAFEIDVFGLSAAPGREGYTFQGRGLFSTDFAAGVFSAQSYVTQRSLVSDNGVSGGGIEIQTAGRIASNGTFAGNILFGGTDGQVPGTLSGRLYGPNGEELGASFSVSGSSMAGSFTGVRTTASQPVNLTLTNLTREQLFYANTGELSITRFQGEDRLNAYARSDGGGQITRQNSETFTYGPPSSLYPGGQFTVNDRVAGTDPNFIAYRKNINGQQVSLEMYRPGSANTELALTYTSLVRWSSVAPQNGVTTEEGRLFSAYGLRTPTGLLAARTSTGRYEGVAYGAAANAVTGAQWDVRGTSKFDVDFGTQRFTGGLALRGTGLNGAAAVDFGTLDTSGSISSYSGGFEGGLSRSGVDVGQIRLGFYGPDGEELAGAFSASLPTGAPNQTISIAGATAARRQ
jgi:hypothetical protein